MTQDLESVPIMLLFHKNSITQGLLTKRVSFTSILCTKHLFAQHLAIHVIAIEILKVLLTIFEMQS